MFSLFRMVHMHVFIFIALLNVRLIRSDQNQYVPSGNQCNRNYLNYKVASFTIQKHVKMKIYPRQNFVPDC